MEAFTPQITQKQFLKTFLSYIPACYELGVVPIESITVIRPLQ